MKSSAQVVVIGGGVVGCSVLYHLAKFGWTDALLIERDVLTCGSTWHAAGGFHTLNGDPNVAKLQDYTISLYKEIQAESGENAGVHLTGGVMICSSEERMDWIRAQHAKNQYLGVDTRLIDADEAAELFPIMDKSKFLGGLYNPLEGHLDPAGATRAYARAARKLGASVMEKNRVVECLPRADGSWRVVTEHGIVHAEHVVNAGGLWARECGRMVGLELPILAMAHQYIITERVEKVSELRQAGKELLHCIDFDGEIYMRQEGEGVLLGTYERYGTPWSPKEAPWDFGHELLPDDLERIADNLARGFERFPPLELAGIKNVINGPFTFAPDGNPIIGPVRGLQNYWLACGVMAGFSQGGGVGLALANWMIDGDPGFDVWAMDAARFGDWVTMEYTNAKVRENYGRRFNIAYPNEELLAARPLRTTPVYDLLKARHAVFGVAFGLEHPLWFAPSAEEATDVHSFRRSNDFPHVRAECRAVREFVGINEIAGYAKYALDGPGAEGWLDRMLACRIPRAGRMTLAPMLNQQGRIIGDFTLANLGGGHFFIVGSGPAERYHMRWFEQHLPGDESVRVRALGLGLVGFSVAGPNARELLSRITDDDVASGAFRFMDIREMELGLVSARVGRVSFTGDLGYEIWVKPEYQRALLALLWEAGEDLSPRLFGARAANSLRLEKSFGTWAREYRPIYTPVEAGMMPFVSLEKDTAFIGRRQVEEQLSEGASRNLVTFTVDVDDADAIGDEPIRFGGECVGWVTSGGCAHYCDASVALGYVHSAVASETGECAFEIQILGQNRTATLRTEPLFDPTGRRMRA